MPFTLERMGDNDFTVSVLPDCRQSVIDQANVEQWGTANVVITPARFPLGSISDTALLDKAMFVGVLLDNPDGGLNLGGDGLHWYLGDENDGGDLYIGVDTNSGPFDLEDQLDAIVFSRSNGLTKGTINSAGTPRTVKLVDGTTARQLLETVSQAYANPDYEYRINNDGTIDVNTRANLYPTTSTPTVILSRGGGRDATINGLHADLAVPNRSIRDFRTDVAVNWNDGTNDGTSGPGVPAGSTFVGFDGADIVMRGSVQKSPRRQFHERERWSDRVAAAHWAAWSVTSQQQAANLAAAIASQLSTAWYETQADIFEYDPTRFVLPGDSVWTYDLPLGLFDTSNEVYYRGQATHPKKQRVEAMTCPILKGYGVYLRIWDGSGFVLIDITDSVAFEDGPTTLELGVRNRLRHSTARPDRFNHRRFRNQYRRFYMIQQYVNAVN